MSTLPTHSSADRLLTAEEFFALPGDGPPAELVRGQVEAMEVPGSRHGHFCNLIGRLLGNFVEAHDLGYVLGNDSGVVTARSPDSVRGPDIAYFSYSRMPKGKLPIGYPAVAPELVFEVLSPTDRWKDVLAKVSEFLQAGVLMVVVVDPARETIVVHDADQPASILVAGQSLTLPDLLPGFELPVDRLFPKT